MLFTLRKMLFTLRKPTNYSREYCYVYQFHDDHWNVQSKAAEEMSALLINLLERFCSTAENHANY